MTDKATIKLTGLGAKVRNAIAESSEPDALQIAESVCSELDDAELVTAVQVGVKLIVERTARALRREALQRAEAEERAATTGVRMEKEKQEASEALADITARHQSLVAERFFATWKETPTGRKFLGECTAGDLEYSVSRQLERSEDYIRTAARDERLASALKASRCKTVRDLGYEKARTAVTDPEAVA